MSAPPPVFEAMRRGQTVRKLVLEKARRHGADIDKTFRAFDTDRDGAISPRELAHGLRELHVSEALDFALDEAAAESLVATFDLDHDGRLTAGDWHDYFSELPTPPKKPIVRVSSEDRRAQSRVDRERARNASHEWHPSLREFETVRHLGQGAFGKVELWVEKATGRRYACKMVNKLQLDMGDEVMLEREIEVLKSLRHPHIVALHRVFDTPYKLYMLQQFCDGGDLYQALVEAHKQARTYAEDDVRLLLQPVLDAIAYLHDKNIAHRDLKPENLLLCSEPAAGPSAPLQQHRVMICDFGFARRMDWGGAHDDPVIDSAASHYRRRGGGGDGGGGVGLHRLSPKSVRASPLCMGNCCLWSAVRLTLARRPHGHDNVRHAELHRAGGDLVTRRHCHVYLPVRRLVTRRHLPRDACRHLAVRKSPPPRRCCLFGGVNLSATDSCACCERRRRTWRSSTI